MKSLIFLSLYALAGLTGWSVYHYTLANDGAASLEVAQMIPKALDFRDNAGPSSLYRWQDETGKWQYSNKRPKELDAKVQEQASNYVDELNALKSLPVVASEMARHQSETVAQPVADTSMLQKARNLLPGSG